MLPRNHWKISLLFPLPQSSELVSFRLMVQQQIHAPALQDPLWLQLSEFPLDQVDAAYPFSLRLARENRWSHLFALRVCEEYKRFLFLAIKAGHMVTPSLEVDQAWHLHLVYTRSYWNELCKEVLGKPVHHGPTKGGVQQANTFFDAYQATLHSYENWFGIAAPEEIWPAAEKRFAPNAQWRWIDLSQHWLLPRPSWRPFRWSAAALLPLVIAACSQQSGLIRADLFIGFIILFFLVTLVISVVKSATKGNNHHHNNHHHGSSSCSSGCSTGTSGCSTHSNHDNSSSCGSDSGCSSSGCSSSGCGGGGCGGGGD